MWGTWGLYGATHRFIYFWLPLWSWKVNNAWSYSPVTSLCYLCNMQGFCSKIAELQLGSCVWFKTKTLQASATSCPNSSPIVWRSAWAGSSCATALMWWKTFLTLFWVESKDYPESFENLYVWDSMAELHRPRTPLNNHYYEAVKNQFVINSGR